MPNRLLLACLAACPLALPLPALAQGAAAENAVENSTPAKKTWKERRAERKARSGAQASEALALVGGDVAAVAGRDHIDALIKAKAKAHNVPESFVHYVVKRESNYNSRAIGRGGVIGLMQIKHGTARGVGYSGSAAGLLDANTNLTYGIAYLAGAYRTANGDQAQAYRYYARGYYYDAKRKGLTTQVAALDEPTTVAPAAGGGLTGTIDRVFSRRTARATMTASADPDMPVVAPAAAPAAPAAPALRGTMAAAEAPAAAPMVVDEATFKAAKTDAEVAAVMAALEALPLPPRRPAALRLARATSVVPKTALARDTATAVTASQ